MSEVVGLDEVRDDQKENGASMVEYVLLAALIALICIGGLRFLGTAVSTQYSIIGSGFS